MKILGITGGVGAGKSTVLDFLKEKYHAYVIQADLVGHLVMEPDGSCYDRVVALFGKQVIKNDKTIDRKMVSDVVFGSEIMRQVASFNPYKLILVDQAETPLHDIRLSDNIY